MTDALPTMDKECFFIAPIGPDDSDVRKRSDGVLNFIVARAVEEVGLTAVRADQIASPGQINLQVVDHVLNAKAAVADMTGLNPNVFYEIAIRHTARLPLVLIADVDCKLPFDISNMRTIFFDHTDLASSDSCRTSIVTQLREVLKGGVVDSPIATSLDLNRMSSGSPVERGIADILSTLEEVAQSQRRGFEGVRRHGSGHREESRAVKDLMFRMGELEDYALISGDEELQQHVRRLGGPAKFLYRDSVTSQAGSRFKDPNKLRGLDESEERGRLVSRIQHLDNMMDGTPERDGDQVPVSG
jgi:hypothetical protein